MKKLRVLVVDDSRMTHVMLEGILEKTNFEICGYAKNSADAVEMFKQLKPDIVTMDMNLPDEDGMVCSRKLLQIDPNTKIVMVSAMRDASLIVRGRAIGISSFLQKPVSANDLIDTLAMVCQSGDNEAAILQESYVKPFVKSVQKNLYSLANLHGAITVRESDSDKIEVNGIAVIIGLTGYPMGRVVFSVNEKAMFKFAGAILDMSPSNITEDEACACMEETANIIAGRSVSTINDVFRDKEFRITPPGTILGKQISIVNPQMRSFDIVAKTEIGELKVNIGFAGGEQ